MKYFFWTDVHRNYSMRAVGRACGRILNGVKLWFPLNNFSLLWPIHTKLAV